MLDRKDTEVLYNKLASKDNLIEELQNEIELLRNGSGFSLEPVNDDNNKDIAFDDSIREKNAEIQELAERVGLLEIDISSKDDLIKASEQKLLELRAELERCKNKDNSDIEKINEKSLMVSKLEIQVSELREIISKQSNELAEKDEIIKQKSELVNEKVHQIEAIKLEFGDTIKLREELENEKQLNGELLDIQKELEDSINDYETRLSNSEQFSGSKESISLDVGDIFPVITDNSVLNARKIGYIREVGHNPWLEDFVCYLSAMLKSHLQDTGIEPYFVILDDLSSDIHKIKYKEYDFTLNALPAFGAAPESNVTVTSYTSVPDLKAHLNISNQEFVIFIDRYGKSKPYVKRGNTVEYNLVNNSELVNLCNLPKDDSLIATFTAKNLENCVEIPSDYALRGKRDRISLFLSKKAYTEVLDNLKAGLFK